MAKNFDSKLTATEQRYAEHLADRYMDLTESVRLVAREVRDLRVLLADFLKAIRIGEVDL